MICPTIVGTGYLGLVSGANFSEIGAHVTCVDVDAQMIALHFQYLNVHTGIDSVYDNWVISTDGDVVNYL